MSQNVPRRYVNNPVKHNSTSIMQRAVTELRAPVSNLDAQHLGKAETPRQLSVVWQVGQHNPRGRPLPGKFLAPAGGGTGFRHISIPKSPEDSFLASFNRGERSSPGTMPLDPETPASPLKSPMVSG